MIWERFYDPGLSHMSYLVGCEETKQALVVDPNRDAKRYIEAAEWYGLRITHVVETHIHDDFVSGVLELAHRTGAQILLSREGDQPRGYTYARSTKGEPVWRPAEQTAAPCPCCHGDKIHVGHVLVEVLHTPGHTPEHISLVVTEPAVTDQPIGVFTGDFLLAGDVGAPDASGPVDNAARRLFDSLQRFVKLPNSVQIWPAHGPIAFQTTLGYERAANWALKSADEDSFVKEALRRSSHIEPAYVARLRLTNRTGPRVVGPLQRPVRLPETKLDNLRRRDVHIIDTRRATDFVSGHVPGTINIPLDRDFPKLARTVISENREVYLVVEEARCRTCLDEAVRYLTLVGLEKINGYFDISAVDGWPIGAWDLQSIKAVSPDELLSQLHAGVGTVIDVRSHGAWNAGHISHAVHIPLPTVGDRLDEVSREKPLVVYGDYTSMASLAASLLKNQGFDQVAYLKGGFAHWQSAGQPIETGSEATTVA